MRSFSSLSVLIALIAVIAVSPTFAEKKKDDAKATKESVAVLDLTGVT